MGDRDGPGPAPEAILAAGVHHVALVGLMGSGKTTVGRLLAARLPIPGRRSRGTLRGMCRSIRQLRRGEDAGPATTGEARAAAVQYVRKVSGYGAPSARHQAAFQAAVDEIAVATERLLAAVGTAVAEGPDPFADPVTRRAILASRPAARR